MTENMKNRDDLKAEVLDMLARCQQQTELNHTLMCSQFLIDLAYDMEDAAGKIFGIADDMLENARFMKLTGELAEIVADGDMDDDELTELRDKEQDILASLPDYGYILEDDDEDDADGPAGGEQPADGEAQTADE